MTHKEFFDKVARMRKAQKDYFRTRSGRAADGARRNTRRSDGGIFTKEILNEIKR